MSIELTDTQKEILNREIIRGYKGARLLPIFGSGEHRSAYALERREMGEVVSGCQLHPVTSWFFKLKD